MCNTSIRSPTIPYMKWPDHYVQNCVACSLFVPKLIHLHDHLNVIKMSERVVMHQYHFFITDLIPSIFQADTDTLPDRLYLLTKHQLQTRQLSFLDLWSSKIVYGFNQWLTVLSIITDNVRSWLLSKNSWLMSALAQLCLMCYTCHHFDEQLNDIIKSFSEYQHLWPKCSQYWCQYWYWHIIKKRAQSRVLHTYIYSQTHYHSTNVVIAKCPSTT